MTEEEPDNIHTRTHPSYPANLNFNVHPDSEWDRVPALGVEELRRMREERKAARIALEESNLGNNNEEEF